MARFTALLTFILSTINVVLAEKGDLDLASNDRRSLFGHSWMILAEVSAGITIAATVIGGTYILYKGYYDVPAPTAQKTRKPSRCFSKEKNDKTEEEKKRGSKALFYPIFEEGLEGDLDEKLCEVNVDGGTIDYVVNIARFYAKYGENPLIHLNFNGKWYEFDAKLLKKDDVKKKILAIYDDHRNFDIKSKLSLYDETVPKNLPVDFIGGYIMGFQQASNKVALGIEWNDVKHKLTHMKPKNWESNTVVDAKEKQKISRLSDIAFKEELLDSLLDSMYG